MPLIACEGLDGAGTTTLSKQLRRRLNEDHDVFYTSEPYSYSPPQRSGVHEKIFTFLHDRAKHCRHMKPTIESKDIVICDRYRDSTLAYQAHDYAEARYSIQNQWLSAVDDLIGLHEPWLIEPDATVYIDVPVKTAMRRNDGNETYEELEQAKEVYDYLYHGECDTEGDTSCHITSDVSATHYHDSKTVIVDGTEDVDTVVDEALWKLREYHSLYE